MAYRLNNQDGQFFFMQTLWCESILTVSVKFERVPKYSNNIPRVVKTDEHGLDTSFFKDEGSFGDFHTEF